MHNAYIIESGETAAGIVTREGQVFVFHAAISDCQALDGQLFHTVAKAQRAADALCNRKRPRAERRVR